MGYVTRPFIAIISCRRFFDHNGRGQMPSARMRGAFLGEAGPMRFGRTRWLWMAAALGLTGCRAVGTGSLSLHPRPGLAQTSLDLEEFVAEHNRNAEAIQSLEARPSIIASVEKHRPIHVDGQMALERPRNFELALSLATLGRKVGDIGSNDEEFWYWISSKEQPYIYWCRYDELESSALPVTYQPDWIIDALGLKPITPEELGSIRVGNGLKPGTTVLTFPPVRGQGEPYTREMVVSNSDHRVQMLRIFSEKPRTLIAEAVPSTYQSVAGDPAAPSRTTCYLPQKLKLDWKREQLVMDVTLRDVQVNQFDHAKSARLFTEPDREGYTRKNLAELSRGARPEVRTRTRQTMPPPDSTDGVRLGRPAPLSDTEPALPGVSRRMPRPARDADEKPLNALEEVVGPPVAMPPNSGPPGPTLFSSAPGLGTMIER
jgi:hypothetical protein